MLRAPSEPVAATVRRLASAQKSSKGAPAYSRFVNRPAGRLFAALAYRLGLTPDAVTGVSACVTFTGIVVVAWRGPRPRGRPLPPASRWCWATRWTPPTASSPGCVAAGSPAGEWLDHMVDAIKIVVAAPGGGRLALPLHRSGRALGAGALRLHRRRERAFLRDDPDRAVAPAASTGAAGRASSGSALRSLAVLPTDYGVLCLAFALLAVPRVFLATYAVLAAGTAGYTVLAAIKWFRELRALGAATD